MKSITEISNKMPFFIDPCAKEATAIHFLILSEHQLEAFNAVKDSALPKDLIEYLTEDDSFIKTLSKAGFCFESISGEDTTLEACAFMKILGKYDEDLFGIIAPFVVPNSYIEMKTDDNSPYRWEFDGSICEVNYSELDCDCD